MVMRQLITFSLIPFFAFSGEFEASVSKNAASLNEPITLTLTLKDASPSSNPSLSSLTHAFFIHSEQQFASTQIINGRVSYTMAWKITLSPKKEGQLLIPSISVDTTEGIFSTESIVVEVVKGSVTAPTTNEMTVVTTLSEKNPYKNQPVFYTVKLIAKVDLANVMMEKFTIDNAIVELTSDPKTYRTIVGGVAHGIVEWNYVITPLKAGELKIPSFTVQGRALTKGRSGDPSDHPFGSFFNMSGLDLMQPFSLPTEEKLLEINAPPPGMSPWLPAKSLKIEEGWDETATIRVGEPLTRSLIIRAEGLSSSQLPHISESEQAASGYKIYADKPESGDEINESGLFSFRKEQYTLIPEQEGDLVLPEIAIAFWDVTKKEKVWAKLPSRTLHVLPSATQKINEGESTEKEISVLPQVLEEKKATSILMIGIVVSLLLLLLLAIFWAIALQKKLRRMTVAPVEKKEVKKEKSRLIKPYILKLFSSLKLSRFRKKKSKKDKNEKLPDLNPT